MKLLSLNLENFQGLRQLSLDFNGHNATIYGDNGTGKTTVFNAVTWLLFDKPSTGAKGFTPKTRDGNEEAHNLNHSAEGVFQTNDGRIVSLKKVFHEVYKKKRGSAVEEFSGHTLDYYVDGVPEKEKAYTDAVSRFCDTDPEIARILTMVDYFPAVLDWQTRRKMLLEVCGDLSDDDIIENNSELSDLRTVLKIPGKTDKLYDIDDWKRIATAKRTEINRKLAELPARIDEAEKAIPDISQYDADAIEQRISKLEKEKEELNNKRSLAILGDFSATSDIRQRIADCEASIAERKAAYTKAGAEKNSDIDLMIAGKRAELTKLMFRIHALSDEIASSDGELLRLNKTRLGLLEEYDSLKKTTFDESDTVCPTCGQPLPLDKVAQLRSDFNLKKSKRLEEINARGKAEASKEKINALELKKVELKKEYDDSREKYADMEREYNTLLANRVDIAPFESTEEYIAIANELYNLRESLTDSGKASTAASAKLTEDIQNLNNQIRDEKDKLMAITIAESQHRRIGELERQEKDLAREYDELEAGLHLCDLFTKCKVEALTERINQKFKNVRFRLFVDQINGGVKDGCDVMIPKEDGTLVPYADANNAAKINAGLEIIDTLSAHFDTSMPTFLDNAEGVTHPYELTNGQLIKLAVSEKDKTLRLVVE